MVAYNFQPQFADMVASGEKRQIIRAVGKRRLARPGDKIQLYAGQRTKQCRKLGETICESVDRIMLSLATIGDNQVPVIRYIIFYDSDDEEIDRLENANAIKHFAKKDGFGCDDAGSAARHMAEFFLKRAP